MKIMIKKILLGQACIDGFCSDEACQEDSDCEGKVAKSLNSKCFETLLFYSIDRITTAKSAIQTQKGASIV